jgi:hypothetical protein
MMHDPTSRSWRVSAIKGDRPVFLYTVTTDAMVRIDLSLPKFASLIESARRIILSQRTAEHNHIDLATGAFIEHVRKREYSSTKTLHVESAEHSPSTAPIASAGGAGGGVLCSIWEEEKWVKIKEAVLNSVKWSRKQVRFSPDLLRDRWDLSDEEIRRLPVYASLDAEVTCKRAGDDLIFCIPR